MRTLKKSTFPLVVAVISMTLVLTGSWPGWLSSDSNSMRQEAISREFTDWHSPTLSWIWSFFSPEQGTFLFPYLTQQAVLWIGVVLILVTTSQYIGNWAALLPLSVLLSDHLWVTAWIWKDATSLSFIVLAYGFLSMALFIATKKPNRRNIEIFLIGLSLSAVMLARWYMIPSIFFLLATFFFALRSDLSENSSGSTANQRSRNRLAALLVGGFLLGAIGTILVTYLAQPSKSYHSSSLRYLDIWRAQCIRPSLNDRQNDFPSQIVVKPQQENCMGFTALIWNPLNYEWNSEDVGGPLLRLPQNDEEEAAVTSVWVNAWRHKSIDLIYARVLTFEALLRPSDVWVVQPQLEEGEARLHAARLPSRLIATVDLVASPLRSGGFYILFIPLVLSFFVWRKFHAKQKWIYMGLLFPLAWTINFAALAPAADTRYVAPAVAASICFSMIIWAYMARPVAASCDTTDT